MYPSGRRGFSMRGRQTATALVRSQFVDAQRTNSARRIQKDLKELEDNKHLLVGVSAAPLPNSLYQMVGNLRGPAGTKWEGAVFHFEMTLPMDYPVSPPKIRLCTPMTHPNVFGGFHICLDMLQKNENGKAPKVYEGWVPAYSLLTILIQLQSFIFEEEWKNGEFHAMTPEDKRLSVKKQIEAANAYKCPLSPHKGALEPYPPFPKGEEDDKEFVELKSPKEYFLDELLCFQTKTPLKEATLGVGISLNKSVQTLEIKNVNPTMDLISMRAFEKNKVRYALEGERFSHWLPLYFGEDEEYRIETEQWNHDLEEHEKQVKEVNLKERFERHFFNSLAFIMNGNIKKPITAEGVLAFFPRLITTHIVDLCNENRHTSIVAIRRLFNFLRLFHMCIKKFPEVSEIMDAKLKDFIEDPNKRLKDPEICPNLGDLQVFALMSQAYNFEDIKESYCGEQLDRQVFWMLQQVPELDFQNRKIKNKGKVSEEKRMEVCFEIGKVGAQVTTYFHSLNQIIQEKTGNLSEGRWDQLALDLDQNHGCIDTDLENKLQQKLKAALKMKSFQAYFNNLDLKIEGGKKGISEKLIQAVKNSRAKGYHDDDLFTSEKSKLPPIPDQSSNKILSLLSSFNDLTTEKYEKEKKASDLNKDSLQIEERKIEKSLSNKSSSSILEDQADPFKPKECSHIRQMSVKDTLKTDEDWKALCAQQFPFIKQELMSNKDLQVNAAKLAQMHDDMELNKYANIDKALYLDQDKLAIQRRAYMNTDVDKQYEEYSLIKDYDEETFTYKKLMIKLVFEELVKNVALNYNFEFIYEFLKLFVSDLEAIKWPLIDTSHLKSNNYYLMAIIPKLVHLKIVKFYQDTNQPLSANGVNFLKKALSYFNKQNGQLLKFEFRYGFYPTVSTVNDYIYGLLKQMPSLQVLKMNDYHLVYPIKEQDAKAVGKYISEHQSVRELDLSYTGLSTESAKEIADGLMRAKNIEVLKLRGNPRLDASQVLYNLAFSPKIKHIDLTGSCINLTDAQWKSLVESLSKLLNINGSIETILFGQTQISKHLTKDFCKALGQSISLQYINLDQNSSKMEMEQQLVTRYPTPAKDCVPSTICSQLFRAFAMNAYKNGQLKKVSMKYALNNIDLESMFTQLYISEKNHEMWYGDLEEANKMKKEQLVKKLYCGLEDLDIGFGSHKKDLFSLKTYQKQKDPKWPQTIQFFAQKGFRSLQIPKCGIDNNAELWNSILGQNPLGSCKLQVLNLSSNNIGINGAKLLAGAFEHNNSIEFLDLSSNDLQVHGSYLLCKSLQKNTTLKGLNLFKNSIDVDGCRAVRELIKVNQSLEFLDLGHNRIRAKGLEAISEGINAAEASKLKTLGLRMNFLNDDSIHNFMNDVVFSNMGSLENIYIKYNNISQGKAVYLKSQLDQAKSLLYVDEFEKLVHFNDEERKSRTLWFQHSGPLNSHNIKSYVATLRQNMPYLGLVKNISFKRGHKIKNKSQKSPIYTNCYFYVEFDDQKSKSKERMTWFKRMGFKAYHVGSNTYVQIRKSVKGTKSAKTYDRNLMRPQRMARSKILSLGQQAKMKPSAQAMPAPAMSATTGTAPPAPGMPAMPPVPQQTSANLMQQRKYLRSTLKYIPALNANNPHLKQQVAGCIYEFVQSLVSDDDKAPKITGKLIELPVDQIKEFMIDWNVFEKKVTQFKAYF